MSVADRVRFESVAGDLLEVLGYETEGVRRPISPPERWAWRSHDAVIGNVRTLTWDHMTRSLPTHLQARWAGWRHRVRQAVQAIWPAGVDSNR